MTEFMNIDLFRGTSPKMHKNPLLYDTITTLCHSGETGGINFTNGIYRQSLIYGHRRGQIVSYCLKRPKLNQFQNFFDLEYFKFDQESNGLPKTMKLGLL